MYTPLHCHSHWSLLDGLSKPSEIVNRIKNINGNACAITDHGTGCGWVDFYKACKNGNIKSILGNELYICKNKAEIKDNENKKLEHLPVLAKNKNGFDNLVRLTSEGNRPENFYYKPRLSLEELSEYLGDIIGFSGHLGSHIGNCIFKDGKFNDNWKAECVRTSRYFQEIFGKENFFLEVQLMDSKLNEQQKITAECVREIAKFLKIDTIATPDAHYCNKEDSELHRILLCTNLKTTFDRVKADKIFTQFFESQQYHIPSYDEMLEWHTQEELENTNLISEMCEKYDILSKPLMPKFDCPDNLSEYEYMRKLCIDGWFSKIKGKVEGREDEYGNRVKEELRVINKFGFSGYFLILKDIIDFVEKEGGFCGPGRGSAGGCIVSYLLGITKLDPIKYGLIFERFLNEGRGGDVDIDIDIPDTYREKTIDYIKNKYGEHFVGQIATYQTLKGRGALKAVFRAYDIVSFSEMNEITKNIVDESKIADELQEMKEETGDSSIIRWALENNSKNLAEWCTIDKKGNLSGPLAEYFEKAIRLEGTKSALSKHAAGVIIGPRPLNEIAPMVYDSKSKQQIVGYEMHDANDIGLLKLDLLGLSALSKFMGVQSILRKGEICQ